jgi:flagellar biosynthesis anti-sigma factor FlgM
MRINLQIAYDATNVEQTQKTAGKKADLQGPKGAPVADPSSAQVQLSGLQAKVAQAPEIRQNRVDQLRQAIASGTHAVSNDQLAGAILGDRLQGSQASTAQP